jgi:hypothetical protein
MYVITSLLMTNSVSYLQLLVLVESAAAVAAAAAAARVHGN